MYKHLLICNIFFIYTTQGNIIPPITTATKTTLSVSMPKSEKYDNNTQTVPSEGESVMPSDPVTLPNVNYITLINLEKEMSVSNKQKPVVPRKGVDSQDEIKGHDEMRYMVNNNSSTENKTYILEPIQTPTIILNETNLISNDVQKKNDTKIHKPLFVSSEAVARMDKMNNVDIDESSPSIKIHAIKAGSHPGMIMPIVITILVVPMFAVVGYLALKRGQEAWKNRHYKRMDFLLDGMYND